MSLWAEREYYQDLMSPDEEHAWAEHDRRCGHTSGDPGVLVFGAGRKDGTPDVNEDMSDGLFSRFARRSFSPIPATERVSPSASGLLLSPPRSPDAESSKEAA